MRGFQWLYREGGSEVQYLRCCNRTAVATPAVPLTRAGTHIIPRLMEDSCQKRAENARLFAPFAGNCCRRVGSFVYFVYRRAPPF